MIRFSNGQAIVPTIQNVDIFSRFQFFFAEMAAVCPDFKWLGFWILDPIQNPGDLQPYLFCPFKIQIQTSMDIRSPL